MIGRDFENVGESVICVHGHNLTACAMAHSNALVAQLTAFTAITLYTWHA